MPASCPCRRHRFRQPRQCRQASVGLDHCGADFVAHAVRRAVGAEANLPLNLESGNSLLAGRHQVHDLEPVAERLVRVLKNRPGNHAEPIASRAARRAFRALPMPFARRQVIDRRIAATRAADTLTASVALSGTPWGLHRPQAGNVPQTAAPSSDGRV